MTKATVCCDDVIIKAKLNILYSESKSDCECLTEEQVKEIVAETYLVGENAPTTETVAQFRGQLYVDTAGDGTYQCTAITTDESTGVKSYTWVKLIRSTDYADENNSGVIDVSTNVALPIHITVNNKGKHYLQLGNNNIRIANKNDTNAIRNCDLDYAIEVGLTTNTRTLTDGQQTSACDWLGAVKKTTSAYKLYGTNVNGKTVAIGYTNATAGSNIVQRNPDGSIQTIYSTGQVHAVNNDRMISYVRNLPDNLTLTEEQKAKWKAWIESILT